MSFTGSRFSSESAPRPFHHGIRERGQTSVTAEVAPGAKLRVGMIAITVLGGVAEPVARFVGQKLGVAVEPVLYPNPEAYLQSFGKGEWGYRHRAARSCPG